jgi:hypothetical protein
MEYYALATELYLYQERNSQNMNTNGYERNRSPVQPPGNNCRSQDDTSTRERLNLLSKKGAGCFLILLCVSCASSEKRARQEADYRANFERTCTIKMSEVGDNKGEVSRQQFLPGTKVEVRVTYFTRGENLKLKIEGEHGETAEISSPLVLRPVAKPSHPKIAYAINHLQTPGGGGGLREELPPQYYAQGNVAPMTITEPDRLIHGGYSELWSRFECPKEIGSYLVVLDRADREEMRRLKTCPFSVVSTLQHEEGSHDPAKN